METSSSSSPAVPEAAGLQKLPRQEIYCAYGGVGVGGGSVRAPYQTLHTTLRSKTQERDAAQPPHAETPHFSSSLSRLPVRLVVESKAAPPGCVVCLQHLVSVHGRRERGAAFQGGICRLAHLQVLLAADNKTMLLRCYY